MLSGYYTATLYVLKQHFKPVPTEQHQYELSEQLKCHISSNETEMQSSLEQKHLKKESDGG